MVLALCIIPQTEGPKRTGQRRGEEWGEQFPGEGAGHGRDPTGRGAATHVYLRRVKGTRDVWTRDREAGQWSQAHGPRAGAMCSHSTCCRLPQALRAASGPFFRPVGPALEDSKGLATVTLRTCAHKPERHRGLVSLF